MTVGIFGVWNDLCQSFDTGEEGQGWPSYEAALTACTDGADMPAYVGQRGLVFGRSACAKAEAAVKSAAEQVAADRARRAAVVDSIAAQAAPTSAAPTADARKAAMLAANKASLAAELAKGRKADKAEVARLQGNITKLGGVL